MVQEKPVLECRIQDFVHKLWKFFYVRNTGPTGDQILSRSYVMDIEKFSQPQKNGKDWCYPTKRMIFSILIGAGPLVWKNECGSVSCYHLSFENISLLSVISGFEGICQNDFTEEVSEHSAITHSVINSGCLSIAQQLLVGIWWSHKRIKNSDEVTLWTESRLWVGCQEWKCCTVEAQASLMNVSGWNVMKSALINSQVTRAI